MADVSTASEDRTEEAMEFNSLPEQINDTESGGAVKSIATGKDVAGEVEEPFKKPSLFVAPSSSGKKAGGAKVAAHEHEEVREPVKPEPKEVKLKPTTVKDATLKLAAKAPPLPYSEPPWGCVAQEPYSLEILKSGSIVDTVPLNSRGFFVVGRLPVCDVALEHPCVSRYHAVLQYRGMPAEESGFYAYDLGSTHGSFINKNRIPAKTYIRLRVGHVIKFGGSTRLFILKGPDSDEEAESDLSVTELREKAKKQRDELERRMMGGGSDEEDDEDEGKEKQENSEKATGPSEDSGCTWGMVEEALPEEDENEENPFATEFHEDQEAAYLKDPKKALQGFYDREGEELEYEYEDKGHGTWTCRVKLPVDDALGRQLVAEVTHSGKKKEAAIQCSLEACRMLEARGLLRQEAVSRKRKKKNWEDDDFYDSDDDTFLDRTGTVEKKRQERMKRAGKVKERPDTYNSLLDKLSVVEKEVEETEKKLNACGKDRAQASTDDPLDAFMSDVRSCESLGSVERRKLHLHAAELRREAQRLRRLVELTRPSQLPALHMGGNSEQEKKKLSLPLFGAMKGGCKFKLKTGALGKLPTKRANLPPELFNLKELPPDQEEVEEEEDEEERHKDAPAVQSESPQQMEPEDTEESCDSKRNLGEIEMHPDTSSDAATRLEASEQHPEQRKKKREGSESRAIKPFLISADLKGDGSSHSATERKERKKPYGPSKSAATLSTKYPEDDPDYCVWVPPAGQSGDGRTHLNDKYGY